MVSILSLSKLTLELALKVPIAVGRPDDKQSQKRGTPLACGVMCFVRSEVVTCIGLVRYVAKMFFIVSASVFLIVMSDYPTRRAIKIKKILNPLLKEWKQVIVTIYLKLTVEINILYTV